MLIVKSTEIEIKSGMNAKKKVIHISSNLDSVSMCVVLCVFSTTFPFAVRSKRFPFHSVFHFSFVPQHQLKCQTVDTVTVQ